MTNYDIPLTLGIIDQSSVGLKSFENNLKKIVHTIMGAAGLKTALDGITKFGEAIRKRRTFEILGGHLEKMRSMSEGVVSDIHLMQMYTELAARGMTRYANDMARAAGRLNELGVEPETLMRAAAGGRLGALRSLISPAYKMEISKAKTEQEKLKLILDAINSKQLDAITGYNTLADSIERMTTSVENFVKGPGWQMLKVIGAVGIAYWSLLRVFKLVIPFLKEASLTKLISGTNKKWTIGFTAGIGLLSWILLGPLGALVTSSAGISSKLLLSRLGILGLPALITGIFKSLGLNIKDIYNILPQFIGGMDTANRKFMISKQLYKQIRDTNLVEFFQKLGKTMLWFADFMKGFNRIFSIFGELIGKAVTGINELITGLNSILGTRVHLIGTGELVGAAIALGVVAVSIKTLVPLVGMLANVVGPAIAFFTAWTAAIMAAVAAIALTSYNTWKLNEAVEALNKSTQRPKEAEQGYFSKLWESVKSPVESANLFWGGIGDYQSSMGQGKWSKEQATEFNRRRVANLEKAQREYEAMHPGTFNMKRWEKKEQPVNVQVQIDGTTIENSRIRNRTNKQLGVGVK